MFVHCAWISSAGNRIGVLQTAFRFGVLRRQNSLRGIATADRPLRTTNKRQTIFVLWSNYHRTTFNLDFGRRAKNRQATQGVARGKKEDCCYWLVGAKLNQRQASIFSAARRVYSSAARWARITVARSLLFLESFLKRRKRPMVFGMWRMAAWLYFAALKRDAAVHEFLGPKDQRAEMKGHGLEFTDGYVCYDIYRCGVSIQYEFERFY
jgi:hypothetical protein